MPINYIAVAIPVFFVFIGIELWVAKRRGLRVYRTADALTDLGCGVGQQTALVFYDAALLGLYVALYRHRFVELSSGLCWPVAFVAVEIAYYAWHRASHRVNFLWAAHAVHHQSEDYNLAVALRQAVLTTFTTLPFNLPLALLGVPPLVYTTVVSLTTLYQFWIHTELVRRLPRPLEAVLNTPSHHRVHHAINERYLDKNYGAVLIVWDKLFGTFAQEEEPCRYGTVKRLEAFDPVFAQFADLWKVVRTSASARGLGRVWAFVAGPEWTPEGKATLPPMPKEKIEAKSSSRMQRYALWQFAPLVVATFFFVMFPHALHGWLKAAAGGAIFLTLASVGALLEGKRYAVPLEVFRCVFALTVLAAVLLPKLG